MTDTDPQRGTDKDKLSHLFEQPLVAYSRILGLGVHMRVDLAQLRDAPYVQGGAGLESRGLRTEAPALLGQLLVAVPATSGMRWTR